MEKYTADDRFHIRLQRAFDAHIALPALQIVECAEPFHLLCIVFVVWRRVADVGGAISVTVRGAEVAL